MDKISRDYKKILFVIMLIALIINVIVSFSNIEKSFTFNMLFNLLFFGSCSLMQFNPKTGVISNIIPGLLLYSTVIMPLIGGLIKDDALRIKFTASSFIVIILLISFIWIFKDISKAKKNSKS